MNKNNLQNSDTKYIEKSDGLDEIEKIKINAKKTKITNDILKNASEFERKLYLIVLCSIADKEDDFDVRNNQLMFINQIIEGNSAEDILETLMRKSKIIDNKFLADFAENITNKISESFAVDALILYGLNPKNEKMLEYITEIFTLLNCKDEKVRIYCEIAQAILDKNIDKLHEISNVLIGNFVKYIDSKNDIYYTDDFFSCRSINKEIFIIGQTISNENSSSSLNIYDHISSKKITFSNCIFKKITLIRANGRNDNILSFANCSFYDCGSSYRGSHMFYSTSMEFVLFDHCYFNGCKSCTDDYNNEYMIFISEDGRLIKPKYENCRTRHYSTR